VTKESQRKLVGNVAAEQRIPHTRVIKHIPLDGAYLKVTMVFILN